MDKEHLAIINELLGLGLRPTVRGTELKGVQPDSRYGGTSKLYLNANDCESLAKAFETMAKGMKEDPAGMAHRIHCGPECLRHQGTGPCDLTSSRSPHANER